MPGPPPVDRSAHRQNRRYVITLAVVAAGILVVGSLLRPRQPTTDEPVPGPSQAELSRLNRLSQRRSLDSMTEYFGTLARDVESSVVNLVSLNRTGLLWEAELVLTARGETPFPQAATLSTPDGNVGVVTVAGGPHLPIAALRTSAIEGLRPPRRRAATLLAPGAWTLALWRRGRELGFSPGNFLGIAAVDCGGQTVNELVSNGAWTPEMIGGGVFDLDENLVAVIVRCGDRLAAITTGAVVGLLREAQSLPGRLIGRFGFRVDELTGEEHEHFGQSGSIVVREVWSGSLADQAGLAPGDVLVAIDGVTIDSFDRLEPVAAMTEVDTFAFTLQRSEDTIDVQLTTRAPADEGPAPQATADGLVWQPPPGGVRVDRVAAGSRAEAAGIRGGDRVLRIDGEEIDTADQVLAMLSPDREAPVFVELARDDRRWGVLLP